METFKAAEQLQAAGDPPYGDVQGSADYDPRRCDEAWHEYLAEVFEEGARNVKEAHQDPDREELERVHEEMCRVEKLMRLEGRQRASVGRVRILARGRAPRPARNARSQGSRRTSSRSARGGSSGDDPDESDPEPSGLPLWRHPDYVTSHPYRPLLGEGRS